MSFIVNRISNMSIIPPQLLQKRSSELSLDIGMQGFRQELFNLRTIQIRNAKKQSFYENKIILVQSIMTLINVFVISITIFKSTNNHSPGDFNDDDEQFIKNSRLQDRFLIAFSICVGTFQYNKVALNVIRNICTMQLENQAQNCSQNQQKSYLRFGIFLILQSVFYFVHPSSFTNDLIVPFTSPPFQLNNLLSCIVYLRFAVILRFLLKLSLFYGLRVNRVLSLYIGDQKYFGILYTIKCFLKHNGLKSPFIIYGIIIFVFPFFILSISRRFSQDGDNFQSSAGAFLEAIYDILISMVTIGYGDLPHDYGFQRIAFVLIIVLGSLSSSFFTLTFLNWFKLSEQEEKALRTIKRLSLKKNVSQINSNQVRQFIHAFVKLQKNKLENKNFDIQQQSNLKNHLQNPKNVSDLEQNQNLRSGKKKIDSKNLQQKIFEPQKKYLNQRLYDMRDNFKDFYERSQLELSDSLKLLIERTLLTNNLLQFYLMRQKNNNKVLENSLISDSTETIKSRKRVDDNKKMYEIRNQIIKSTYQQSGQAKKKKEGTLDTM